MIRLTWKPKTNLEKSGLKITQLLRKNNFQSFFVGGIVRDRLLKRVSTNLDIATDALPAEVEKILDTAKIRHKQVGKKYGTILAIVSKELIEITTFRRESKYSDQRHPDKVEFIKSYLDDAKRRDLTINTIYFDPIGQVGFDPVKGSADIAKRLIRFVGDPKKRIDEDPLRMLRAVRLATTLGFKFERNSFAAIKTRAKLIQTVSTERIKQELDKLLVSKNRDEGVRLMAASGLLKFIVPEFEKLKNVFHKSKKYHLEGSVFDHTLLVVKHLPPDLDLIYAGLFHDIGKIKVGVLEFSRGEYVMRFRGHQMASRQIFSQFAIKYKFSKESRELIDWLIEHHDDRSEFVGMNDGNQVKYGLHPDFSRLVELWRADSQGNLRVTENSKVEPGNSKSVIVARKLMRQLTTHQDFIKKYSSGNFIMREAKISAGIKVGQIADKLKINIILGKIKSEQEAKEFIRQYRTGA